MTVTASEEFVRPERFRAKVLRRRPHALADGERSCLVLKRFAGIDMPAGWVLGPTRRGWRRGEPWGEGYGTLDRVTASEILRDLTEVTAQ